MAKATHIGDQKLNLTLIPGEEWCSYGSPLYLRSMKFGKKTVSFVGKPLDSHNSNIPGGET